jgi:hypothetical protein
MIAMTRAAKGIAAGERSAGDSGEAGPPLGTEAALEALRWNWGTAYDIGCNEADGWHARRRDGKGRLITTDWPGELRSQIVADYTFRAVPWEARRDGS